MNYFFTVELTKKTIKKYKTLARELSELTNKVAISDEKAYNQFLRDIITIVKNHKIVPGKSVEFDKEIKLIENKKPLSEMTAWGGVNLKKVDVAHNYIRKLLVIRQFGILGFEIHKEKLERLRVTEGDCVLLSSNHKSKGYRKGEVKMTIATVGDRATFVPEDEHGIIALTNCIVEEQSTNHLDDLIFLYNSKQVI